MKRIYKKPNMSCLGLKMDSNLMDDSPWKVYDDEEVDQQTKEREEDIEVTNEIKKWGNLW